MPKPKVAVAHQGAHHMVEMNADVEKKTVAGTVMCNFSDHGKAEIHANKNGRLSGSILHAGNTHALGLSLNKDGTFSGDYKDLRGSGLEFSIRGNVAKIKKGSIPMGGSVKLKGDHHEATLNVDEQGVLSGYVRSKSSQYGTFSLGIDNGNVTGKYSHKGRHHWTNVELGQNGWKGDVAIKKGNKSLSFKIDGDTELKLNSAQFAIAVDF
jgi:hypothetical protein